jgi:hypothetical protein
MPIVEHRQLATGVTCEDAFDLSMSHARRFDWDPFLKAQRFLDDATEPGVGVQTWSKDRRGLVMVTRYLTFQRPHRVGMKMMKGPPIFRTFSGAWAFSATPNGCEVVFRYNFSCQPKLTAPIAERIGQWYLGRDIRIRNTALCHALQFGMRASV